MILAMTIRQTAMLGIVTMLVGSLLFIAALYLAIAYDILGKLFPNSR